MAEIGSHPSGETPETTPENDAPVPDPTKEDGSESQKNPTDSKNTAGFPVTGMEKQFSNFMHPALAKMEEQVRANTAILDEMQRKYDEEREANRKAKLSKHIPGPLKGEGQELNSIMQHIQNLIMYENYNDTHPDLNKLIPAHLKELDSHGEIAVLGHSLAAYVSTLDYTHLRQFASRIISDTTLWISRLFRFNDSSAYFHDEEREGLVRVCRLALHQKFPKFASDGYDALYTRTPIIYISSAAKPGLGQYICSQLGLPQACLCTVPCGTTPSKLHKMDVAALEKLIQDDIGSAKMPVLVIAHAGSPLLGHVDSIDELQEICKKNEIWLHIEGNNLATLTMFSVPTSISPAKSGDSMTLNLGGWLGLPAVPFVTLYKTADPALAHAAGLASYNLRSKLSCLPLWLCLQSLGHEGVIERVKFAIQLAKIMAEKVGEIPTMKLVGIKTQEEEDEEIELDRANMKSVIDFIGKAISALLIFEIENPAVVFRYKGSKPEPEPGAMPNGEISEEEDHDSYYDALNLWLSETVKREVPRVHISTIEIAGEGLCIRFCPLETAQTCNTLEGDVSEFLVCLERQLQILDATVSQRADFQAIVEAQDNLRLVTLPNWAGLGAVQYVPETWLDQLNSLPDEGRREVNTLNTNLVQQLKSADTAFSLGTSPEALACVRFGLITEETDLEELIGLVYSTGKDVEESSKFLETIGEVVRQNIEKAQEDLLLENQKKLQQEGVLRQVPLVGSLLNWWSPPSKEVGVKGRMFNLASGQIESTEATYKYHMQIKPEEPAQHQRQQPLKASLKPVKHRRISGHSTSSTEGATSNTADISHESLPHQETQQTNDADISGVEPLAAPILEEEGESELNAEPAAVEQEDTPPTDEEGEKGRGLPTVPVDEEASEATEGTSLNSSTDQSSQPAQQEMVKLDPDTKVTESSTGVEVTEEENPDLR